VSLPSTPVNMWAMRAFDTQSTINLGGAIDGSLTQSSGMVSGTLVNHTPYALTDCAVWFAGRWQSFGTFAPGASSPVQMLGLGSGYAFVAPTLSPPNSGGAQSGIQNRMQAALAGYFQSLGQNTPNYYNQNYSGGLPPSAYSPASNEALLIGWSSDPTLAGPSPRIDGHSVTENNVSLIIVHVPVFGVPTPVTLAPAVVGSARFGIIARSSAACRRALTASALGIGPASQITGRPLHILGIVTTIERNPTITPGAILLLTQGGVPAVLPFSTNPNDQSVRELLGQEVLVTGVLTRPNTINAYPKELVVSHLQVVH
jgi:hypothetical protein